MTGHLISGMGQTGRRFGLPVIMICQPGLLPSTAHRKAAGRRPCGRRCSGDFCEIDVSEILAVGVNVVEVIVVYLLLINDLFENFHACAVAILTAHQRELIVCVNGIVFQNRIEGKDFFRRLAFGDFSVVSGCRIAAKFFDALRKHLGMPHFIDGD